MRYDSITLTTQYVSSASASLFLKMLVTVAPPFLALSIRGLLGGTVLMLFAYVRKVHVSFLFKQIPVQLIKGALFRVFLPSALAYWALQYVTATKLSLFYNLNPFIAALFSYLLLGELITRKKMMGIVLGFGGLIPLFIAKSPFEKVFTTQPCYSLLPELAILASMICLSYGWIEMKKLLTTRPDISVYVISAYDVLLGSILAFITSYFFEQTAMQLTSMGHFVFLIIGATICIVLIANPLNAWHLRRHSPILMSIGSLTVPFFTALLSWIFLKHTIGWEVVASTLFVLVGFMIFYQEEHRLLNV